MRRCQKNNLMNVSSETEELQEIAVLKETEEELEDESESEKREDASSGGSRKHERWDCPGCKRSMQRANKNRHIRRCEIVLEAENLTEITNETEEQHEDAKTDSNENPKMWECSGCKKTMQKANKNRHIRRCEVTREADNSIERTNETDEHYEDVKIDFDETDKISNEIKQLEMEIEEESAKNDSSSTVEDEEGEDEKEKGEEEKKEEEKEEFNQEAMAEDLGGRKYKDERVKCDVCEIDLMKSSMRRHMKRKHDKKDTDENSDDVQDIGEE